MTNPFDNAVWSYGHRNPQGLVFHPNGNLYATEHGPDTRDELNIIKEGQNYGWPDYLGKESAEGIQPALSVYTERDTIAIAGLTVYEGSAFPWQDNLLFVSLKTGQLYRLELNEQGDVIGESILLDRRKNSDLGRLRDVAVSPDGLVYLATSNINDRNDSPHPEDDRIVVLKPLP